MLSPFGRVVLATTLATAVACAGSTPPAAAPSPVASTEPLPAMFDIGAVPDRPHLEWPNRTRTVVRRDTVTGQYVAVTVHDSAPGDSVAPDTNDSRLYYKAGLYAHGINPSLASAAFYWASRLDPGWADPYFARWYTLRSAPYAYTFRFSSHRDAGGRTIMDPRAPLQRVAITSGGGAAAIAASSYRENVASDPTWGSVSGWDLVPVVGTVRAGIGAYQACFK
jgi:hypothetical protein